MFDRNARTLESANPLGRQIRLDENLRNAALVHFCPLDSQSFSLNTFFLEQCVIFFTVKRNVRPFRQKLSDEQDDCDVFTHLFEDFLCRIEFGVV